MVCLGESAGYQKGQGRRERSEQAEAQKMD
jgi:hypothetical protein